MENKIFTNLNLENNNILNVKKISAYSNSTGNVDSTEGITIDTPNKLYETWGNHELGTISDSTLLINTNHIQSYINDIDLYHQDVDVESNTVDTNVSTSLTLTSPSTTIKNTSDGDKDKIEILNTKVNDKDVIGTTVNSTNFALNAVTASTDTKTYEKHLNNILTFSKKDDSFLDVNKSRSRYNVVVDTFAVGSNSLSDDVTLSLTDGSTTINTAPRLYVDTTKFKVNVPVNSYNSVTVGTTSAVAATTLYGSLTQSLGNVTINDSDTTIYINNISGKETNVNSTTISLGNTKNKTKTINIGTASETAQTLNIANNGTVDNYISIGTVSSHIDVTSGNGNTINSTSGIIDTNYLKIKSEDTDSSVLVSSPNSTTGRSRIIVHELNSNYSEVTTTLNVGKTATDTATLNLFGTLNVKKNANIVDTLYLHSSTVSDSNPVSITSSSTNNVVRITSGTDTYIRHGSDDKIRVYTSSGVSTTQFDTKIDANQSMTLASTLTFDALNSSSADKTNRKIIDLNNINTSDLSINGTTGMASVVITPATSLVINDATTVKNTFTVGQNSSDNYKKTTLYGDLTQSKGNVSINDKDKTQTTSIEGASVSLNAVTDNIGNLDSKTTTINIGTSTGTAQTINIASGYTDDTITIGTVKSNINITSGNGISDISDVNYLKIISEDTEASVLVPTPTDTTGRSRVIVDEVNSNFSEINTTLNVGKTATDTATLNLFGTLNTKKDINVVDTLYLHSSTVDDSNPVSITSSSTNNIVRITSGTDTYITHGDSDKIRVYTSSGTSTTQIDTKVDANQSMNIANTITFDASSTSNRKINDLNLINTSSLSVNHTDGTSSVTITPKTSVVINDATTIKNTLTVGQNSSGNYKKTTLYGDLEQSQGNVSINNNTTSNTTTIKAATTTIQPVTLNLGNDVRSTDINIGTSSSDVDIQGSNSLRLQSTGSNTSSSEVSSMNYYINNNTKDTMKFYWDTTSSSLVFEAL